MLLIRSEKIFTLFFCSLFLAGCSTLPSAGPTADDVVNHGTVSDEEKAPPYVLIDLDQHAASMLEKIPSASFYSRFGSGGGKPPIAVIGVGDSVQVTIWEAATGGLFSSASVGGVSSGSHSAAIPEQLVGRDGSITVPYAGRIHVVGSTPGQVEKTIISHLEGKAIEPQVLVTVPHNVSNMVTVTGEVSNGARVPLTTGGDRVLDVIASAGGMRAPVHDTFIELSRGTTTGRLPMQALLSNPRENVYVRPGDVITVVSQPQTFTVFGATGRNALVPFDANGITLEEAIAKSGGILDGLANPEGVFLMREETIQLARALNPNFPYEPGARKVNVVYRVNMRDANTYFVARRTPVRNKDMIYVAASLSTEFQKAIGLFTASVGAAAGPAMAGVAVTR